MFFIVIEIIYSEREIENRRHELIPFNSMGPDEVHSRIPKESSAQHAEILTVLFHGVFRVP